MTVIFVGDRKALVIPDSHVQGWALDKAQFVVIRQLDGIPDLWINADQILMIEE
jgi:hypothetical protein